MTANEQNGLPTRVRVLETRMDSLKEHIDCFEKKNREEHKSMAGKLDKVLYLGWAILAAGLGGLVKSLIN